jgi:uncharacterized protein
MTNRGPNTQNYSGKPFYVLDPDPDDVCIDDIAHSLALICRFNGHCRWHYSVAQHSVLVSYMVPQEHALQALLHDAPEAYVGDMCRPMKVAVPDFPIIEHRVWHAVAQRFGVPVDLHPSVKQADRDILYYERKETMNPSIGTDWGGMVDPWLANPPKIHVWDWQYAEVKFLQRFEELTGREVL